MTRRLDRDDPERLRAAPVTDLPLFGQSWPVAPSAPPSEQRVLSIAGTIQQRYDAFRASEDGLRVWQAFCRYACEEVAMGATRLSAKELVERIRFRHKVTVNNSFTALLARDCEATCGVTRGLFERRVRRAS